MNDREVIDHLRTALDDVHHDRPLAQVARRARVLKARRRLPGVAAASIAVAAAITVGVGVTAPSSAFADWTSQPKPADPAVAFAIDASCKAMIADDIASGEELFLLDVRGEHAMALYRDDAGGIWDCARIQGTDDPTDPDWWLSGGGSGPSEVPAVSDAVPLAVAGNGAVWASDRGEMSYVYGRVVPDVDRVEVGVPGATVTAVVVDGWFEAWWPSVAARTGTATITAYDDAGAVVTTTSVPVASFGV